MVTDDGGCGMEAQGAGGELLCDINSTSHGAVTENHFWARFMVDHTAICAAEGAHNHKRHQAKCSASL